MKVDNPNSPQANIFEFNKANIFHQLVLENTLEHVLALMKKAEIAEKDQVIILGKIDEAIKENKSFIEDMDEVANKYMKLVCNNLQLAATSYTKETLNENKRFIADFEEVWQKLIKQKKQERLTLAEKVKKTKTEANKVAEKNEQDRDVEPSVALKGVNITREKGDRPYQEDEVAAFHLPDLHPSWENHIPEFMALAIQQLLKKLYTSETLRETYNKQSKKIENKKIADFSQTAGATFTLAWRDKDQLITAWVGDSPGILLFTDPKSGAITKIQSLTCPHLPNSTYEFGDHEINRARQTQEVEYELGIARVSKIMLSRSIGDLTRGLSDTPSFSTTKIPADQDVILVLGSDGLFDCLTYDDIKETYVQAKGDEQLFVKLLREKAYKNQYGLADNITVLEVKNPQVNDYFCVMDGHASKYIAEFIKKYLPEIVKELAAKPAPQGFLVPEIQDIIEEKKAEVPAEKSAKKRLSHLGFEGMFTRSANSSNEVVAVDKEKNPISKTYHYLIKFDDYKNIPNVKIFDYFIADLTLMDVDTKWQEVKSDLLKITAEIANKFSANLKEVGKYLGIKIYDYIQTKIGWGARNKNPLYQACMGFIAALSLDKYNIRAIRFIGEQSSFRKKLSEVSSIEKIETYVEEQKKEFEKVGKQDQFKVIDKFFNGLMQPAEKNTTQLHF